MKKVTLMDLVGEHRLEGVDFGIETNVRDSEYEKCQAMRFRLDGVTYMAIEDPSDGYRSSMEEIVIVANSEMTNTFPGVVVGAEYYGEHQDILKLVDMHTREVILEVGTNYVDDYYPCFVSSFRPEAMSVNRPVEEVEIEIEKAPVNRPAEWGTWG